MSMYPDDQMLEIFGEQIMYPGLDPVTHKFTDGDFSNPLIKPSHIPAASFNLILDNLENLIRTMGFDPNNTDPEQLKNALLHGFSPRMIGNLYYFQRELSPAELVRWRLLPLKGQLIWIADYQEIFDLMYCGDDNNDTSDWWFRCDEQGNRTIEGEWTCPTDWSGLFPRVAGMNSKYTAANNTPYDGFSIGAFTGDTIRGITGHFTSISNYGVNGAFQWSSMIANTGVVDGNGGTPPNYGYRIYFSAGLVVPTSYENRGASFSIVVYMQY